MIYLKNVPFQLLLAIGSREIKYLFDKDIRNNMKRHAITLRDDKGQLLRI